MRSFMRAWTEGSKSQRSVFLDARSKDTVKKYTMERAAVRWRAESSRQLDEGERRARFPC